MLGTLQNLRDEVRNGEIYRGAESMNAAIKNVVWPVALFATPWAEAVLSVGGHQTLRNRSDLLMGFELDESASEPVTVEVGVGVGPHGHVPLYPAIVRPGKFVPAFNGVHCLPTSALSYNEIRMSCDDPSRLRVVLAVLSREGRKELALGQIGLLLQFDNGYHVIDSGVCREWIPGQRPRDATPYLYPFPRLDG